jgi:hypothetical protein
MSFYRGSAAFRLLQGGKLAIIPSVFRRVLSFTPVGILHRQNDTAIFGRAPYGCLPVRLDNFFPVKLIIPRHPVDGYGLKSDASARSSLASRIDASGCLISVSILLINRFSRRIE